MKIRERIIAAIGTDGFDYRWIWRFLITYNHFRNRLYIGFYPDYEQLLFSIYL